MRSESPTSDLGTASAMNLVAWHQASLGALGSTPRRTGTWWTCALVAPCIYHSAISLRRAPTVRGGKRALVDELRIRMDDEVAAYHSVCDSFCELDLTELGLDRRAVGTWYSRPATGLRDLDRLGRNRRARRARSGLNIDLVRTPGALAVFEATTCRGFEAPPPIAPFDIHAPGVLPDARFHLLLGFADSEPVTTAMAYEAGGVLGIYGVATVPTARGRGFATAMTIEALSIRPDLTAVLQPSEKAAALYRRLGFTATGTFAHWA